MSLLQVDGLSAAFSGPQGPIHVLNEISFAIGHGKTTALVGESGSGKTLTAMALMGMLPARAQLTSGSALFGDPKTDGPPIDLLTLPNTGRKRRHIRGGRIGLVIQEPSVAFSPLYTIGNQIAEVARIHCGLTHRDARDKTVGLLTQVHMPEPATILDRYPFELSGGQRQRAMIAMALAGDPVLIIADEPTTALDVTLQAEILALLQTLQADLGLGILLITHDLGVVAQMADAVTVLHQGRVMERGPTQALFQAPRHAYLKGLLAAAPRLAPAERNAIPDKTAPLIEAHRVTKTFRMRHTKFFNRKPPRPTTALSNISLRIHKGECVALVGESGSGKTTLAKLLVGAHPPDSGHLIYHCPDNGIQNICAMTDNTRATFRRHVQYIFQDPFSALSPRMTVGDSLCEPLLIHGLCARKDMRARAGAALEAVGLSPDCAMRYPHAFSGGQRQRIAIARALMTQPDLLILDEPTAALDTTVQAQILDLLADLKQRLGLTMLFVTHHLAVAARMADRIAVMRAGRIVETAAAHDLIAQPQDPYTQRLLTAIPTLDPVRHTAATGQERTS